MFQNKRKEWKELSVGLDACTFSSQLAWTRRYWHLQTRSHPVAVEIDPLQNGTGNLGCHDTDCKSMSPRHYNTNKRCVGEINRRWILPLRNQRNPPCSKASLKVAAYGQDYGTSEQSTSSHLYIWTFLGETFRPITRL